MEKLHSRDAILVNYGGDQFGFVHRTFQEYFAAQWMAQQHSDLSDFKRLLLEGVHVKKMASLTDRFIFCVVLRLISP